MIVTMRCQGCRIVVLIKEASSESQTYAFFGRDTVTRGVENLYYTRVWDSRSFFTPSVP